MNIQYLGDSSFKISSKEATILTDPGVKGGKISKAKGSADIVIFSQEDFIQQEDLAGNDGFILQNPGEFEIKEVLVDAYYDDSQENKGAKEKNIVAVFNAEGIRVAFLGKLRGNLNKEVIENLGTVDILLLPIEGENTIDVKEALTVIKDIDPRMVIPYELNDNGKISDKNVKDLADNLGIDKPKVEDKLSIKSKELSPDNMELVLLKA